MQFRPYREQSRPTHARRRATKTDEMQARAQHECGEPLHEFQRRHHEVGRAVAKDCFQLEHDLPCAVHIWPLVGHGGVRDVAAQVIRGLALLGIQCVDAL